MRSLVPNLRFSDFSEQSRIETKRTRSKVWIQHKGMAERTDKHGALQTLNPTHQEQQFLTSVATVGTVLNAINGQSGFEDRDREPGFYCGVLKVDPLAFMAHLPNITEVWTEKKKHMLLSLHPDMYYYRHSHLGWTHMWNSRQKL